MPLLKDKLDETKLKSLPFGNDRPDGGSSNQPYIQNPIDVNLGVDQYPKAYDILGNDFLLRGGVLGAVNASTTDVVRLTKFFNPLAKGASLNGALFVAKQAALERQGVDVRDGRSRTYLPTNTIAQAGVNAFGLHLDKDGLNPFKAGYYGGGDTGYFPITLKNETTDFEDGPHNRLQLLYQVKRLGDDTIEVTKIRKGLQFSFIPTTNQRIAKIFGTTPSLKVVDKTKKVKLAEDLYGITNANDNINLLSYGGGPGSFLGVGKTNIKIWNPLQFRNFDFPEYTNITKNEQYPNNPYLYLTPGDGEVKTNFTILRETKLNTSETSFSRKRNGQEKIFNPNLSISSDQVLPDDGDIINFYFELINNDGTNNNTNTKIPLRAYIEDFSDNFTGEWDAFKYMGRAENFYRYKGFTRDFNITFNIPTLSRTDLITNYQKLNALTWLTMPDYSDQGYIRGNLAFFTMGDYFDKAVIVMKSLTFTPIMEMGFDINRSTDDFTRLQSSDSLYTGQLPKGIKVSCTMTPLTQKTNVDTNNSKDLFYTPQRGEAFIGNRIHVIKDRPGTIGAQYSNENGITANYQANNPEDSGIFKNS